LKNIKGILFIVVTTAITFALWFFATPKTDIVPLDRVRHIVAGLALNGFFINFLLASRNKIIEGWFNGLDKLYVYHKYIAITSLVLVLIHAAISDQLKIDQSIRITTVLGGLGLFLFVVLAGITLFDKRLKYEEWRISHRLMLIAYTVALFHVSVSSKYDLFNLSPLSIWVVTTSLVGYLSGLYVIFFYQNAQFTHKGKVTKVTRLSPIIVEWEITLDKPMDFVKGQFIFIKVFQKGMEKAPHPFSLSGGDGKKIYLTTKNSGDFTKQIYESLELNTRVSIDGPYGHMDFSKGKKDQVWVAGGIGITPFIAYLRNNQIDQSVEMFYSYRGDAGGVYKDFLENYQQNNKQFKVNLIDTDIMKPLDLKDYPLKMDSSVFMCGPAEMVENYVRIFRKKNKNVDLTFEAFKLR